MEAIWISVAVNVVLAMLGWSLKKVCDNQERRINTLETGLGLVKDSISSIREHLPANYPTKDELEKKLDAIHASLRRMEEGFKDAIKEIKTMINNIKL